MQMMEVVIKGFGTFLEEVSLGLHGRGLLLIDGVNHDSTSARSNGAGKTTIPKAITWCLYGEFVDGDKGWPEVVHRRAKKAEVRLTWVDEATSTGFCATRTQTKGQQQLHLEMTSGDGWVSIDGNGKRDTQAKLEEMVGLDYNTWCNTVLYAAGALTRFASRSTSDADRKAMLKQIYGLSVVDEARKVIVEASKELRARLDEAEKAVMRRRAQLETISVKNLEAKRELADREKVQEVARAEATVEDFEAKAKASGPDLELLARLKLQLEQARPLVDSTMAAYKAAAAEHSKASEGLEGDPVSEQRQALAAAVANLGSRQRSLKDLRGGVCPTCTTPLEAGSHAYEHKERLLAEERDLQVEVARLQDEIAKADAVHHRQQEVAREVLGAKRRAEAEVGSAQRMVKDFERQVAEIEATPESPYAGLIVAKRNYLEQLRGRANVYVVMLEEARAKLAEWRTKLVDELKASQDLRDDLAYFDFWNEAFSDRGLVTFVIDQMLPALNAGINQKLSVLADGDIIVVFDPESLTKSGEVRDKVGMRTMIEGMDNPTPSTAQDKKICLAGAMAAMDSVASRQDKRIDLGLLDEPFDGLDAVGRQRLMQLLEQQLGTKSTILVTTHDAEAAAAFTKRVVVERRGGVAKIIEEGR